MSMVRLEPTWFESNSEYWFNLLAVSPRDQLACSVAPPPLGVRLSDDAAMFLAYTQALRGAGNVSPNPLVGAVLVDRHGGYLSCGAHLMVGESHAEVNAFKDLSASLSSEGGTLYVTLEPCAHHGRTPPCAEMIARSNINKVIFAVEDPNPLVHGAGVRRLKDMGKVVQQMRSWEKSCEWLMRVFLHNQRRQRIFTAMKVASTPSGVIAGDQTSRLWITNERSRQMGHFLRLEYDAICVGSGTAVLDDPTLDVRHPMIRGRLPLRVVIDGESRLLKSSTSLKLLNQDPDRTLVVLPEGASDVLEKKFGIDVLRLPTRRGNFFSWDDVKQHLWQRGVRSLLLEGGAHVYESAIGQQAVDGLHWFVAPDERQSGLKWSINSEAFNVYKKGGGIPLDGDRLVELDLSSGGEGFV